MSEPPADKDEPNEATVGSDVAPSEELLRRFQGGDNEALERLWTRYLPRLKRWAHGRLPPLARSETNTDDVVQEAFVRSLRHLHDLELRDPRSLFAYFRTIVFNQIRDYARKMPRLARREALEPDAHITPQASPLEQLVGGEALDHYEHALSTLAETDQQIVRAFVELGCNDSEIAELFERPSVNAARMARARAIARLVTAMQTMRDTDGRERPEAR
jgi:RNA polymerase sigma-70 factor (ECF subfamily)